MKRNQRIRKPAVLTLRHAVEALTPPGKQAWFSVPANRLSREAADVVFTTPYRPFLSTGHTLDFMGVERVEEGYFIKYKSFWLEREKEYFVQTPADFPDVSAELNSKTGRARVERINQNASGVRALGDIAILCAGLAVGNWAYNQVTTDYAAPDAQIVETQSMAASDPGEPITIQAGSEA